MYPEDLDLNCREKFKLGIFIIGVSIFYFLLRGEGFVGRLETLDEL